MKSRLTVLSSLLAWIALATSFPVSAATVINLIGVGETATLGWVDYSNGSMGSLLVTTYNTTQAFLSYSISVGTDSNFYEVESGWGEISKRDFTGNIQSKMTLITNTSASANPAFHRSVGSGGPISLVWFPGPSSTRYTGMIEITYPDGTIQRSTGNNTSRSALVQGTIFGYQPEGMSSGFIYSGHRMSHTIVKP